MRQILGYTISTSPLWGFLLWLGFGVGVWAPVIAVVSMFAVLGVMWLGFWIADA